MVTWIICGVFLVSIAVAAVKYVSKCRRRLSDVNTEIERVLASGAVDEALKESKLLKPAWNAFEKTLTRSDDAVYSTKFFRAARLKIGS